MSQRKKQFAILFLFWINIVLLALILTAQVIQKEYGFFSFLLWVLLIVLLLAQSFYFITQKEKAHSHSMCFADSAHGVTVAILCFIVFLIPSAIILSSPNKLFFHGDEAIISRNAEKAVALALKSGEWNFFGYEEGTLNKLPGLWYVVQGLVIHFLGPSVQSIKTFSLIIHSLLTLVQFALLKKVFNKYIALAWVLFYLSFPLAMHFSLTGYQNLQSTFFAVLSFSFAALSILAESKHRKVVLITISSIGAGVGMYFYLSSILTPVFVLCLLLISAVVTHQPWKQFIKLALLFLIPFILITLPFFIVSINDYNFLTGRAAVVTGVLTDSSAANSISVLKKQLLNTLGAFWQSPMNGDGEFYVYLSTFIHPILSILTVLGIVGAVLFFFPQSKKGKPVVYSFLVIIVFTLLFGSVLTINPPAVQRIFTVFPYLTIFTVTGIWILVQPAKRYFSQTVVHSFFFVIIFCVSIVQYNSYFDDNIPRITQIDMNNSLIQAFTEVNYSILTKQQQSSPMLFTQIPTHQIDQIYYYSDGQISPIQLKESVSQLDNALKDSTFIFLLSDNLSAEIDSIYELNTIWSKNEYNLYYINGKK